MEKGLGVLLGMYGRSLSPRSERSLAHAYLPVLRVLYSLGRSRWKEARVQEGVTCVEMRVERAMYIRAVVFDEVARVKMCA